MHRSGWRPRNASPTFLPFAISMLRGIERARRLTEKRKATGERGDGDGNNASLAKKVNDDLDRLEGMIFDAGGSNNPRCSDSRNPRNVARDAHARLDKIALASVGGAEEPTPPPEPRFDEAYLRQDLYKGEPQQYQREVPSAATTSRLPNLSPTMDRASIVAKANTHTLTD